MTGEDNADLFENVRVLAHFLTVHERAARGAIKTLLLVNEDAGVTIKVGARGGGQWHECTLTKNKLRKATTLALSFTVSDLVDYARRDSAAIKRAARRSRPLSLRLAATAVWEYFGRRFTRRKGGGDGD